MKRFVVALASAAFLGAAAWPPAHAEPIAPAPFVAGLPPYEILTIIRSTGFEPVGRPIRRPGVYVVRAVDPYDQAVDLTVDARTGRILTVRRRVGPAMPAYAPAMPGYGPPPRYGAYGPPRPYVHGPRGTGLADSAGFEDATGTIPLPPRAIPAPGGQKAGHSAAMLPLPRPRPVESASAALTGPELPAALQAAAPEPPKASGPPAMPPVAPLE